MKTAVFPGSFDPFTLAHQDLVHRALILFDKIIVAVGVDTPKKGLMDYEQRLQAIAQIYATNPKVEVLTFTGLTVDFCRKVGADYILRGLRNAKDLDYESAIAQNNLLLAPHIETYFLLSRGEMAHISSTIVREIWANKGRVDHLIPAEILKVLKQMD